MSARESHYSEGHFFCNTFFRFVSSGSQLRNFTDRSRLQDLFQATQTTLTREDTRSHHSHEAHQLYVWIVANALERDSNSLENSSVHYYIKNRSPNVWRKHFVFIFHGPTISSAVKNSMDQRWKRVRVALASWAYPGRLIRSYKKLCEHAANVCKVF